MSDLDLPDLGDVDPARIIHYRLSGYSPQRIAQLFGLAESYVRAILVDRNLVGHGERVQRATLGTQNSR